MNLYLMRHANAGVPRENPVLDAKRGLVKEGKQQCMLMAGVLTALKAQVDVIIASPLKRSLQSAQFVGTEIGFESKIIASPALAPDGDYAAFQHLIAEYADREGVLVVGHNPNLHQFIAKILNGNGNGSAHAPLTGNGCIRLRKGAIARIDMARRPAQLQWMIDPRLARVIYSSVTKSSRPKTSRK
ncbi:phosphohistidine phosphatase SixA [Acidicapsa ligni]|uniref:phosphohistidine phosphatase SixA n=1 Tax=Acidicapsa ligni TaxID=542300 RepID=UPI0021E03657|nr:phosphohistidine phosphatase SixA [Acidicapsa ligni]